MTSVNPEEPFGESLKISKDNFDKYTVQLEYWFRKYTIDQATRNTLAINPLAYSTSDGMSSY